jgi:NAD(P)-dependent dehydrogenase (short-subunit alcohol dehydrogenase family)
MPEPSLAGKVFIVTAAAAGIGLASSKLLLESGASVGMSDKDGEALADVVSGFDAAVKPRVLIGAVDVSDRAAVRDFIHKTKNHFQRLDGLASVAGVAGRKFGARNVWDMPEDEYDFVMDVNLRGLFNILGESLKPGIMDRPGSIVAVGSEHSFRGSKGSSLYTASKHGLLGMVKSVALETGAGPDGVRINAVLP